MDFDDNEPIGLEDNIGCLLIIIVFIILTILINY
jgi:hypothetical protein